MHSDFLDKFKGKTSKVPKEGVANLLDVPNKKQSKPILIKRSEGKAHSTQKEKKPKRKKQKNSSSEKQNQRINLVSHSKPDLKKVKQKSIAKSREILAQKQNKKSLEINLKAKKQPLKLPKISKENIIHQPDQIIEQRNRPTLKQKTIQKSTQKPAQKPIQKMKRSLLTQSRQIPREKSHPKSRTIESLLDQQALFQLKRLNDFQVIVQELEKKRQQQLEEEKSMHKSRLHKKGLTVHY